MKNEELNDFLDKHKALFITSSETKMMYLKFYHINGNVCIITEFKDGDGWNAYVPVGEIRDSAIETLAKLENYVKEIH